ncbi:9902_t:CDS:2 [Racocetra fulgida]|uniref:9902_t:CDS:1 n=1 Tax=Racocetra fulgida TaxID=60492 RepID=A0A9N9GUB7_9GLOM|nr:9902_t:CDS:2 [Racocetra fulgida]
MNSQIDDLFLEIETLIKLQLKDNVQNNSEVEQKFKDAITLINEIEADDEKQHGLYRYKYHSTYNSYLKTVGDLKNADKQEKLAKKFEKYSNTHAEVSPQFKLFTDVTTPNTVNQDQDCNLKIKEIAEKLKNNLKDELTDTNLGDKFISEIQQIFEKLNGVTKTFDGYLETVNCEIYLRKLADNLINEKLIILEAPQSLANCNNKEEFDNKSSKLENVNTELIDYLKSLKFLAHEIAYSKRIEFISFFSNSSNKIEILFKNVINTEEEINRRARLIGSCFHPDRTKNPNCPFWLKGIYKSQGDELFKLISKFKEHLLNNLKTFSEPEDKISDYEKFGHDLWKITIDYHNASKGEWSKLKVLKEDEIKELSPESLKHKSMYMGELAYHQYRAACKVADKNKLLKKQVKLRGYMALCLYFTNKFLEAPLYALAAIHLQIQNSQNVTQQELNEAKKLFDKVNGRKECSKGGEECVTSNSNTEVKLESDFNNVMTLVKIKDQEISFNHRKLIQNSINKDLNNMATKLFIEADRSLVCYQTSYKEILSVEKHATSNKLKGGATIVGGAMGGGVVISTALGNICEATFEFGIRSLATPAFLVVGAFVIVAAGVYSGLGLYKKGAKMLKEPKIREKLNEIMTKALNSYDKGEYQEFINVLSEEYDEKSHKSLIECCDGIGIKGTDDIVSTLKMHGFRSDGIAYLLVLLGEVLGSGKIKIEGVTHTDLKTHAKRIFREALNNDLVVEARKLDDCTSELRKTSKGDYTRLFKSTCGKVVDSILSREHTRLALEYLDDSLEMPFFSRLEEIRNIARINIAILNITEYDLSACKEAIKIVDEVRKSIRENYQFISKVQLRLDTLEDFLWIISGEILPDTSFTNCSVTTESALELNDKYITYLNNQLSFNQEKTHKYDKAVYFEQLSEKEAKINMLNSLRYWQCAQENYESLRKIDPEELTYSLGYARCLLKLSKYTQVIGLSDTCPALNTLSEYWHFCSIAYFKQAKYKDSKSFNTEALKIDPKNKPADKHRRLINKVNVENIVKHHLDCYKSELIYEADYLKNSHSNERPVYNILSIDGGGIRG